MRIFDIIVIIALIFIFALLARFWLLSDSKNEDSHYPTYTKFKRYCGENNVKLLEQQVFPDTTFNSLGFDCIK